MAFFDEIAKKSGQMITFMNVATGQSVSFPAFVKNFSDSYSVQWGGSTSFGRVDPVKNYQSTGRRISASFDILGKDEETARKNFSDFSTLVKMLYPVYSDPIGMDNKSRTIRAAPLLRIKYANYMRSETSPFGLLGCIQGFDFNPQFESGHILEQDTGEMIPLVYSITFTFEPLHESPLGSNEAGQFLSPKFPYNRPGIDPSARQPAGSPTK